MKSLNRSRHTGKHPVWQKSVISPAELKHLKRILEKIHVSQLCEIFSWEVFRQILIGEVTVSDGPSSLRVHSRVRKKSEHENTHEISPTPKYGLKGRNSASQKRHVRRRRKVKNLC